MVHYIDDFLTIGGPDTKECAENNAVMHEVCAYLGLPTEPAKVMRVQRRLIIHWHRNRLGSHGAAVAKG